MGFFVKAVHNSNTKPNYTGGVVDPGSATVADGEFGCFAGGSLSGTNTAAVTGLQLCSNLFRENYWPNPAAGNGNYAYHDTVNQVTVFLADSATPPVIDETFVMVAKGSDFTFAGNSSDSHVKRMTELMIEEHYGVDPFAPAQITPRQHVYDCSVDFATQISIRLANGYQRNLHIDWGDDTSSDYTGQNLQTARHTYTEAGVYTVSFSGDYGAYSVCSSSWFAGLPDPEGREDRLVELSQWGRNNTTMDLAWCYTYLNSTFFSITATDTPDFQNLDTLFSTFAAGNAVTDIDTTNWNLKSLTSAMACFSQAESLVAPNLTNFVGPACANINNLFFGNALLNDVIGLETWDTSGLVTMNSAFNNCDLLTILSGFDGWDVSGVEEAESMFSGNALLTDIGNLDQWDTGNLSISIGMFGGAAMTDYSYLAAWDVTSLTDATDMLNTSNLSDADYDAILEAWSLQLVNTAVPFGANGAQYTAVAAHDILTDPPNSWVITDGGSA